MWKARSILNGRDTPCLFLYVTYDNFGCVVGRLFYRNVFGIIEVINSNMRISLCLKKMDVYNHIANKQDIREEVERYARVAGN